MSICSFCFAQRGPENVSAQGVPGSGVSRCHREDHRGTYRRGNTSQSNLPKRVITKGHKVFGHMLHRLQLAHEDIHVKSGTSHNGEVTSEEG